MLFKNKEEIQELGFYNKTPHRQIYHNSIYPYLMEISFEYDEHEYDRLKERIIIWKPELSRINQEPILFRGPDAEIIISGLNLTKEEVKQAIEQYGN
jgi:hypothetical protein